MFVLKSTHESDFDSLRDDIKCLKDRYWELWHKHELLLTHFGLSENKIPARTELVSKGSPERA